MRFAQTKDLSIVWTGFLLKIVGVWISSNRVEERRRKYAFMYTITAICIGYCVTIRDFYFSRENVSDCIYVGTNIVYLLIVLVKLSIVYSKKEEFFNLIRQTQIQFWHSNYNTQEQLILKQCKKMCTVLIITLNFCAQGTCAGYIITPILANIGSNQSERMLPFRLWLDLPLEISPYFEILFVIEVLCLYNIVICLICFDNFLFLANIYVTSQFRILQCRLAGLTVSSNNMLQTDKRTAHENACNHLDECYTKFRKCVQQHQMLLEYCRQIENVFSVFILAQLLYSSISLCLVGYQMFLMDTPASRTISLSLNMCALLCQLFIYTYSCDGLIQQSTNVATSMFQIPWASFPMNKTGKILRKCIMITIMRSSKSCCLTASGFSTVSLETFTGVISTAMSYFTLLRQTTIDEQNK